MKRLLRFTIASALVLVAGTALAKPPIPISECGTVIDEPGKYRVTQDLFCLPDQRGIQILASDVTLDLQGHTITCDTSGEERVSAVSVGSFLDPDIVVNDVWVKNGTVSSCNEAVIFFYSQSGKATKIMATGNSNGIFVFDAMDTLIKNNVSFGNETGIATDRAVGTEIRHNVLYDNLDAAIALESGVDSLVACNTSQRDEFGVRIGPLSSGNIVRGNYIIDTGAVGIGVYGIGLDPEQIFLPMPPDNVIKNNVVLGSGGADLVEAMLIPDFLGGGLYLLPECLNTWSKNQYVSAFGPVGCIAPPVELDDDDVCAVDDDD